jgi:FkbM family methyltransferase
MLSTRSKIALARAMAAPILLARRLAGRGPEADVVRRGIRWKLDLREGIDFAIWLFGRFEGSTVRAYEKVVRPGHVVLDVGANVGAHALPLARLVGPGGRVVCFEPTDFAFRKLVANARSNPDLAGRMTLVQAMLVGAANGRVPERVFSSWPLAPGDDLHALHRGRPMTTRGARAMTLDAALVEAGVARVDFVKMDVDGHECSVLRGAPEMLRQAPPLILELSPYVLDETGASVEELLEILGAARYTLAELGSGRPIPLDGKAIRALIPSGSSMNVLATRTTPQSIT